MIYKLSKIYLFEWTFHSKEINVSGSSKVTDNGISSLLVKETKSGVSPMKMISNGKNCLIFKEIF